MNHLGITLGIAGAAGAIAFVIADRLKLPSILLYLAFGLGLGPLGAAIVETGELNTVLPVIVPLAAAIILFEGGLSLDIGAVRGAARPLRNLLTVGVAVSFVGGTLIGWLAGGLPLAPAAIFGSLMIVTGPTVIAPILRRVPLVRRVRGLLHWESILVDPIGIIVAVLATEYVIGRSGTGAQPLVRVVLQIVAGCAVGAAVGLVAGYILGRRYFASAQRADAANITAVGAALASFAAAESLVHEGGIVSVTVAGLTLSLFRIPWLRGVRHFKEQMTALLVATLFVLIAASIDPRAVVVHGWRIWISVALVALVLRPIGVFLSTRGSDLPFAERLCVAWIGPRGIIAAAGASLAVIKLREHGAEGGDALESLVFATIAATVLVQGLSAGVVAKWLGVRAKRPPGLAIAGANELAQRIALCLRDSGVPTRLLDTNETRCAEARHKGLEVLWGSASDSTQIASLCEDRGRFLALTPNAEVNALAAMHARELLGIGCAYRVQLPDPDGGTRLAPLDADDRLAFAVPLDVEVIALALQERKAEVNAVEAVRDGMIGVDEITPGALPLIVLREGVALIAAPGLEVRRQDRCV
ncbi:MAG: sodium:proton antiporter, partial [Bdellovibrionota bacterium]